MDVVISFKTKSSCLMYFASSAPLRKTASMVTLPSKVTSMKTLNLTGCLAMLQSLVRYVVTIDGRITINGKIYATGPRYISFCLMIAEKSSGNDYTSTSSTTN